jgi:hypothetical protein
LETMFSVPFVPRLCRQKQQEFLVSRKCELAAGENRRLITAGRFRPAGKLFSVHNKTFDGNTYSDIFLSINILFKGMYSNRVFNYLNHKN